VALVCLGSLAIAACTRVDLDDEAIVALDATALRAELAAGRVSAERVTRAYLARIAALDDAGPMLGAVIEVNPDAEVIARALDEEYEGRGVSGPLHGVPVLLKANIDTADRMATSAGSLALAEHHAAADADIVARLRDAGAVVLGKTNLSEWANFRSMGSTSGWSSLGGQTRNAYVLDRNPCGSSSGSAVAVAARLAPLAVGTETDGSIVCPAAANGVVGIKPALGTVS
jgi:amidase